MGIENVELANKIFVEMQKKRRNKGMIRKLRKNLKPVIWVMTVTFVLSVFFIGFGSAVGKNKQESALKVNGIKVKQMEVEREFSNTVEQYRKYYKEKTDVDYVRLMAFNQLIEKKVMLSEADKKHIKVSGKEQKAEYNKVTEKFQAKENLIRALKFQGMTTQDLKEQIEESLIVSKLEENIKAKYKLDEKEVKAYYEDNKYEEYSDKEYKDVKEEITTKLKEQNTQSFFREWLESKVAEAEIEFKKVIYKKYEKKVALNVGGYKINNIDFYSSAFFSTLYGSKDKKEAYQKTIDSLKQDVALATEAKKRGLKVDEELLQDAEILELKEKLSENIKENYKYSDKELKKYFDENNANYETKETADFDIIAMNLKESKEDEEIAKKKAEKILEEAKAGKIEFGELAKKYSEGPSATTGGDLGWFGEGKMVPEFDKVVFKTKAGEVYDGVVKTQFGYHIIKVEAVRTIEDKKEVKARHILIKVNIGDKTKVALSEKSKKALNEIKVDKKEFVKVAKDYSDIKRVEMKEVEKSPYVAGIGYNKELSDAIFKMKIDEMKIVETEKGNYIVKLNKHVDFKKANYKESEEKVKNDFLNKKVIEKVKELQEKLAKDVKVEIIDEKITKELAKKEVTEKK